MRLWASLELRHGRVHHPRAEGLAGAEVADRLWESGVRGVHLADVDAATGGRNQWHAVAPFVGRGLRVQLGGGVRSMTQVQQLRDLGVDRVVLGTQAVRHPLWLRETCRIFPGRIVLGLDERAGHLVVDGRAEDLDGDAAAMARILDDAGLAAIHFTRLDGGLEGSASRGLRTPRWGTTDRAGLAGLEAAGFEGATIGDLPLDGEADTAFTSRPEPPMARRMVAPRAAHASGWLDDPEPDGDDGTDDTE